MMDLLINLTQMLSLAPFCFTVADVENPDLKQGRVKQEVKYLDLSKGTSLSVLPASDGRLLW